MAERDEYAVGYGKPPRETRFSKGRSGNPAGRPKGRRSGENSLIDAILKSLGEEIAVNVDGRRRKMTMRDAVGRKAVVMAAQGNAKFIDFIMRAEEARGTGARSAETVDLDLSDEAAERLIRNHIAERDDQTGALDEEDREDG